MPGFAQPVHVASRVESCGWADRAVVLDALRADAPDAADDVPWFDVAGLAGFERPGGDVDDGLFGVVVVDVSEDERLGVGRVLDEGVGGADGFDEAAQCNGFLGAHATIPSMVRWLCRGCAETSMRRAAAAKRSSVAC